MLIDMYLKVEEEVVFCGGAVGKSGEVSTKSSIEDLLSENLVQEYNQGYENKKMWMGDFSKKGSDLLQSHLRNHSQHAGALVVGEVPKLPLDISPVHYNLQ